MAKLPFYHSFAQKAATPVVDLAEKVVQITPALLTKVFFANSGSEANDTAVKMVLYYNNAHGRQEKKKIVRRIKGYHRTEKRLVGQACVSTCRSQTSTHH